MGKAKADGGGAAGLLVIRDVIGVDSIILDGTKGDIILANADVAEELRWIRQKTLNRERSWS
jgi:hypothetical protein